MREIEKRGVEMKTKTKTDKKKKEKKKKKIQRNSTVCACIRLNSTLLYGICVCN